MAETRATWKVIAASVAGTSHATAGTPCQDAFSYQVTPGGILIAAVADGAGSAKRAGEGAALAARTAVEYLAAALETSRPRTDDDCRSLLQRCLFHTRRCLEDLVAQEPRVKLPGRPSPADAEPGSAAGGSLDDFATTLLAVFVTDRHLAALQVGDGAIVYREGPDSLTVACEPDHGEYLNETHFITSSEFERHARYRIAPSREPAALAMLSDGLEMLAIVYRDGTAYGPFFNPLFEFVRREGSRPQGVRPEDTGGEDLREFLLSERVCGRSDDDKTLVLAVRSHTLPGEEPDISP